MPSAVSIDGSPITRNLQRTAAIQRYQGDTNVKKQVSAVLAIALALAALPALAEIRPAPYIVVHYDTIDPAQTKEWNEVQKEWAEAFRKAKAGKDHQWRAYQSNFTYAWVSDMPNFSYLDDGEARDKAANDLVGEGVMERLQAGSNPAILKHYTEIWKFEPDLSYWQESLDPSKMNAIRVRVDTIRPGKGETFQKLVKDVVAAMKKINAEVNYFAYSIPFGKGSYAFVSWGANEAALHSGPSTRELLSKALGEEESQAMFSSWLTHVTSTESSDWSIRKDLAYVSD